MSPERVGEELARLSGGSHDAEAQRAAALAQARRSATLPADWYPVLSQVPLFRSLSKRHLRRIGRLAELRRFKKDAVVVRAGGRGDAFYIVLEGEAEVTTPAGHTQTLRAADYFGELALFDGAPRAATVKAGDGLAAARIPRTAFLKLLKDEPSIGVGLSDGLVAIIRDLQPALPPSP